ncbi:MAG: NAD(P)/FAD-dependent oxidoreductase [Mycobacteriales bacterium]
MAVHDVVIVGGGAAGLSAALVLARARRKVTVVDAGEPRNAAAAHVHGYLSRDGVPPGELLRIGRDEVRGYGGRIVTDVAHRVSRDGTPVVFSVVLGSGEVLAARRLLVATGLADDLPDLPGVRELWGTDVHGCPYCHGWEVRDTPIGVLGTGDLSVRQALLLRQWSDDVVFFPHAVGELAEPELARLARRGIRVVPGRVRRLVTGDGGRLVGVETEAGELVPRTSLFLTPRFAANDGLLAALGCAASGDGWVTVDSAGRTSVAGVWAAGNVTGTGVQVIGAAGAGSRAAIALNTDLLEEDLRREEFDAEARPATVTG